MSEWIPCGEAFIEAGVIHCKEAVWKPKARKNSRTVKIGDRTVTAQVLKLTRDGWAILLVKKCETTNAETWWRMIPALKAGGELRRRRPRWRGARQSAYCGPMKVPALQSPVRFSSPHEDLSMYSFE